MPHVAGDADPPAQTVPGDHFDRRYADKPDPWDLATSWYERRKYALTVASLPRERYHNGFELGCAIGEFTRLLASRWGQLLTMECAVAQTRHAVAEFGHVEVRRATTSTACSGRSPSSPGS